jgi:hypothetical protein
MELPNGVLNQPYQLIFNVQKQGLVPHTAFDCKSDSQRHPSVVLLDAGAGGSSQALLPTLWEIRLPEIPRVSHCPSPCNLPRKSSINIGASLTSDLPNQRVLQPQALHIRFNPDSDGDGMRRATNLPMDSIPGIQPTAHWIQMRMHEQCDRISNGHLACGSGQRPRTASLPLSRPRHRSRVGRATPHRFYRFSANSLSRRHQLGGRRPTHRNGNSTTPRSRRHTSSRKRVVCHPSSPLTPANHIAAQRVYRVRPELRKYKDDF